MLVAAVLCSAAFLSSEAQASPRWGKPKAIDNSSNGTFSEVSCASSSLCVAYDGAGKVFVYVSGAWSTARTVDPGNTLTGVSCPSASFCMLVDGAGHALSTADPSDGAQAVWSAPVSIDGGTYINSVSCVSAMFCLAVTVDRAVTFSNGTWETPTAVSGAQSMTAVSCASSSFCAAVDEGGNAMLYRAGIWSGAHNITGYSFTSVSCSSAAFCVAGDIAGEVSEFAGTSWSATRTLDQRNEEEEEENYFNTRVNSLSCTSAGSCVAVGGQGAETLTAGSWGSTTQLGPDSYFTGVSCSSSSFCIAAGSGNVMARSGGSWEGPYAVDPLPTPLNSISCISSLCLASDNAGHVVTSLNDGATWGAPLDIAPGTSVGSISCPSTTLCVAINNNGQDITTKNPELGAAATWTAPTTVEYDHVFDSMTCASTTLCIIVNGEGNAMTTTDPEAGASAVWSSPKRPSGADMFEMSCPSATLCVGIEWDGKAVTSTNPALGSSASWSAATIASAGNGPSSISCPSTALCVVVNSSGNAEITTNPAAGSGASWHPLSTVSGGNYLQSVACPSTAFCIAGNTEGTAFRINSPLEGSSATWSHLGSIDPGNYVNLACPSVSSCFSVDNKGYGVMYSEAVLGNSASPVLSTDHPVVGATLNVSNGAWEGAGPITYTYQWEACSAQGTACAPIAGASAAGYAPSQANVGATLRGAVTATNAEGSEQVLSELSGVIPAAAPADTHAPTLSTRNVAIGVALSVSPGAWTGALPVSYTYQWQRCSATGTECVAIEAGKSASYTPLESDAGHTLRAVVAATNAGGAAEASSEVSEVLPVPAAVVVPSQPVGPPVAPPLAAPSEPALAIAPTLLTALTLIGTDQVGQVLIVNAGRWTGTGSLTWSYQWQRGGVGGFVDIANATRAGYRLTAEDKRARAVVTVSGPAGVVREFSAVVFLQATPRTSPVGGHHSPKPRRTR